MKLVFFCLMLTIFKTSDGSDTIYDDVNNYYYHSVHGAITESRHVFLEHGLYPLATKHNSIRIFEMGFGTGLNAFLTYLFAIDHENLNIHYTAIEKWPLPEILYRALNYPEILQVKESNKRFLTLHQSSWNQAERLSENFLLEKIKADLTVWETQESFDLIYMDAFSPNDQAELWTEEVLHKFFRMLSCGGLMTTYCAKGSFKRSLRSIGFKVESVAGPMGKREMTLAYK